MKGGGAVRWTLAIVVGGVAALLLILLAAGALLYGGGCAVGAGSPSPGGCAVALQLIPLAFLVLWVALSIFLIRALK